MGSRDQGISAHPGGEGIRESLVEAPHSAADWKAESLG